MSNGTLYTFDLGFNWNAAFIGEAFGQATAFRPLQFGIVNTESATPMWPTAFYHGDSIRFQVTDISHSATASPTEVANTTNSGRVLKQLTVTFRNPSSTSGAFPFQSSVPFYQSSLRGSGIPAIQFSQASLVLQPGDTDSAVYTVETPSWQVARWYAGPGNGQQFPFNGVNMFSEMSVLLEVSSSSSLEDSRSFIFDPEMFIGPDVLGNP